MPQHPDCIMELLSPKSTSVPKTIADAFSVIAVKLADHYRDAQCPSRAAGFTALLDARNNFVEAHKAEIARNPTGSSAIIQEICDEINRSGHAYIQAARLIEAERFRQIREEGYSPEHDATYREGELYLAARCYAEAPPGDPMYSDMWPWSAGAWKPKGTRKNLIRAGALCIAEIDRVSACKVARAHPMYIQVNHLLRDIQARLAQALLAENE